MRIRREILRRLHSSTLEKDGEWAAASLGRPEARPGAPRRCIHEAAPGRARADLGSIPQRSRGRARPALLETLQPLLEILLIPLKYVLQKKIRHSVYSIFDTILDEYIF